MKFDLIIIGGGTSGLAAAAIAAFKRKKVAVIESGVLGGTCLNRGCIPSKLLIHGAELLQEINHAKDFGISVKYKINFAKAMQHQRKTITTAQRKLVQNLKQIKNIKIYKGKATFVDKKIIQIGNKKLTAPKILIAVGGTPFIPKDLENIKPLTSDDVWYLTKQPKTIVLIGGGYISIEFAYFFAGYGSKVYVINRGDRILRREDKEVVKEVVKGLKELGVTFLYNCKTKKAKKKGKKIELTFDNNKKLIVNEIMINAGRKPNTLSLDKTNIKTDKRGFIKVNKYLETNVKGVYAIGDINGLAPFAHTGKAEAKIAVNNMFSKNKKMNYTASPYAIFTYPQVSAVGLSEEELKKVKHKTVYAYFKNVGKAKIIKETKGFVKIMFSPKGKILGARIVGPYAAELIHEIIAVMNAPGNHEEILKNTIHIHPTVSEVMRDLW